MSEKEPALIGGGQLGASSLEAGGPGEEYGKVQGRTQRQIVWRRFRRHQLAMISGAVLLLLYLAAIFGPMLAPYGYSHIDYNAFSQGPSLAHPMGTDQLGRDELTRVIYGGRVSLMVGLSVGVFSTLIGAIFGIVSGFYGRLVDVGIVGFTDFMLVLPDLPLLIVAGSIFRLNAVTISILLVALSWTTIARVVRGQVLSLRNREFVMAAQAIGVSNAMIMARHILPNVVGVMVVQTTLAVGLTILAESALSFLGLGIQPPTPSWGNLLSDAQSTMTQQWWLAVFPGAMIVLTVLCVNFLGDGLRDALDSKAVE
jgi:peptide/nickel transport system permease protein